MIGNDSVDEDTISSDDSHPSPTCYIETTEDNQGEKVKKIKHSGHWKIENMILVRGSFVQNRDLNQGSMQIFARLQNRCYRRVKDGVVFMSS